MGGGGCGRVARGGIIGKVRAIVVICALIVAGTGAPLAAWGAQGHRLVARIAEGRLTPVARQNVRWLLDGASLADVAAWADEQEDELRQTSSWHYVNIPSSAGGYDRNRDCPRQPGVSAGSRADRWRDCIVDRILYNETQVADRALDRAERATALKFLVHLVGDVHQPFHTIAEDRGGTRTPVTLFGAANCGGRGTVPCTLHGIWDVGLMARRRLSDQRYLASLEGLVQTRARRDVGGTAADWARESRDIARAARLRANADAGETYYATYIGVIDERLAIAGLRLAELLNRNLPVAPPAR